MDAALEAMAAAAGWAMIACQVALNPLTDAKGIAIPSTTGKVTCPAPVGSARVSLYRMRILIGGATGTDGVRRVVIVNTGWGFLMAPKCIRRQRRVICGEARDLVDVIASADRLLP